MFCPSTVHNSGSENLIWINKEEEKSDCAYFMYDLFISFSPVSSLSSALSPKKQQILAALQTSTINHQPPPLLLHIVNQHSAGCRSPLCFSLSDWGLTLWPARGLLPSPSANTGLHSYHVSSHYQQSRAPGRQWEDSGRGMERRGPEEEPSITPRPPGPLSLPLCWNAHK